MLGHRPSRVRAVGLVLALGFALTTGWPAPAGVPVVGASLPAWRGGIDLYRSGVFTTQATWLWCTAADIQIARNIVDRQRDHRSSSQRRYFEWMRAHNRYDLPLSAGVDPQGWAAGFRHFVDPRYRLVASRTFDDALRLAVTRLRQTNLPVGITVDHGNHAWLITGFTATADPLESTSFTIRSVRVVGPLYGLQSRNGYDMPPDTKLSPARLRTFFTPWRYAPMRMIWDGRYVSIQPVPAVHAKPAASPSASPLPTSAPAAATSQPPESPPASAATPASTSIAQVLPAASATGAAPDPARASSDASPALVAAAVVSALLVAGASAVAVRRRSRQPGRRP